MKISANKNTISVIILGILIILSLNFFQKPVKGFFYSISSPLQQNLWEMGDSLSDFMDGLINSKNIKFENEGLNQTVRELIAENLSLQELKKENETLREVLELGIQKEFRLALASVISKDISQDAVLINQGSKDGIVLGMPVITPQKALLGKVIEVYDNFSRVMLISNEASAFDAKVSQTGITGVIKGSGNLKISFDLVSQDKELIEGDLVVSSVLGGIYPQGLLVGTIKSVVKSDIKPFYEAEVSPMFKGADELKDVFIILNF
ncbi:MAG: rod shape-determining protein MreC [Candidatus Nealsonbacteria bacterium]|nr:rod shape-determining protein MreC [Candidatus Nealsonbacteria bacterium]